MKIFRWSLVVANIVFCGFIGYMFGFIALPFSFFTGYFLAGWVIERNRQNDMKEYQNVY